MLIACMIVDFFEVQGKYRKYSNDLMYYCTLLTSVLLLYESLKTFGVCVVCLIAIINELWYSLYISVLYVFIGIFFCFFFVNILYVWQNFIKLLNGVDFSPLLLFEPLLSF